MTPPYTQSPIIAFRRPRIAAVSEAFDTIEKPKTILTNRLNYVHHEKDKTQHDRAQ